MDRKNWRLVVNVHVSDDDEQALREVSRGERHETITYFEDTLGRPPGRAAVPAVVGSPDTVAVMRNVLASPFVLEGEGGLKP